jgi:hypothetical protein
MSGGALLLTPGARVGVTHPSHLVIPLSRSWLTRGHASNRTGPTADHQVEPLLTEP